MQSSDRIVESLHREIAFEFVRSSGPGGQNVNKVATAAQLRFDVRGSEMLPTGAKERLLKLAGRRARADGTLIIEARRYRTQEQNRQDATERFDALVRRALEEPKRRLATKATIASKEKRLASKKRKGEIKRARRVDTSEY